MHLLHISHRIEDNMILTTTNTENYGREEIHKTLVQMADVAVPANESDVLWRHATFEEAVAYLVAIAVVLETDSKELFAIVSVFHLTAETARHVSRYATLTQVLTKCRMTQRLFHNITKGIAFRLHSLFRYPLIMRKRCGKLPPSVSDMNLACATNSLLLMNSPARLKMSPPLAMP